MTGVILTRAGVRDNRMKDLKRTLEKLRAEAKDCSLVSNVVIDRVKRATFARIAEQLSAMAIEVEAAIAAKRRKARRSLGTKRACASERAQ
jgi:hypothetical protein